MSTLMKIRQKYEPFDCIPVQAASDFSPFSSHFSPITMWPESWFIAENGILPVFSCAFLSPQSILLSRFFSDNMKALVGKTLSYRGFCKVSWIAR